MKILSTTEAVIDAVLTWLVAGTACPPLAADDQPNVVLIVSDYMGYRDTEPYGATDVRTPSIAELANDGVMFSNFYAAAPVCGPARAALYSGRYPARIGFESNIRTDEDGLDSAVPTLARLLSDAG